VRDLCDVSGFFVEELIHYIYIYNAPYIARNNVPGLERRLRREATFQTCGARSDGPYVYIYIYGGFGGLGARFSISPPHLCLR